MPDWLKLLALMTLVMLGLPAVASAHGGQFDDEGLATTASVAAAETRDTGAASDLNAPVRACHFFEATQAPGQTRHCTGSCCCCQGMSHCGSSGGCSTSALAGLGTLPALDHEVTRIARFDDQVPKNLDPSFGLERPPRG